MSLKEDLTIIFVSYLSKNLIEKPIKQINNNIPIIVVENSKDIKLKEYLENKYKNVDVIIPKENLSLVELMGWTKVYLIKQI